MVRPYWRLDQGEILKKIIKNQILYSFSFFIASNTTTKNKNTHALSDKTVRLYRWTAGEGFVEDQHSPLIGHKYAVTKVEFSPKVINKKG